MNPALIDSLVALNSLSGIRLSRLTSENILVELSEPFFEEESIAFSMLNHVPDYSLVASDASHSYLGRNERGISQSRA